MLLVFLYLFSITYILISCHSMNMLGPANIIFKTFEHCETKATDINIWVTQRKYNRTTNVLDITLASPWPIDDEIILEITAEVKKEGGYKPGSFHMKDTMCTVLSTILGDVFSQFLKVAGSEDCPMPDGDYEVKDFYLDSDMLTVPQLYGEYRASAVFSKGEDIKGCYFIFLDMVPKDD